MKNEKVVGEKPALIGRIKATEMINNSNGRIFTATVITKNNEERTINCRKGVSIGVKKSPKNKGNDVSQIGMVTVWDMQEKSYKTLNMQTLTALKINKQSFKIRKG